MSVPEHEAMTLLADFCAALNGELERAGLQKSELATHLDLSAAAVTELFKGGTASGIKNPPSWDRVERILRYCWLRRDQRGLHVRGEQHLVAALEPRFSHKLQEWRTRHRVLVREMDLARAKIGRPIRKITDPFSLEVHPSIGSGASRIGLPELPTYIPREHDTSLNELIDRVIAGHSSIATLIGGSSSGKTRACWEAMQNLPPQWRLWHPIESGYADAALSALYAIGPRTVVWLNEAQQYLLTPGTDLGERFAAGLRNLLQNPDRAPILVLSSMWTEYWGILSAVPQPGQSDPHAQARTLFTGQSTVFTMPESFSGRDLDAVREAARDDPRLAEAYARAEDGRRSLSTLLVYPQYLTATAPHRSPRGHWSRQLWTHSDLGIATNFRSPC